MDLFKSTVSFFTRGIDGFDWYGFDKNGYDKNGFDAFGLNRFGWDKDGYLKNSYHYTTQLNRFGYDKFGYAADGFDKLELGLFLVYENFLFIWVVSDKC